MRAGISYLPLPNHAQITAREIEHGFVVQGVQVVYAAQPRLLAEARGIFWRRIVVGPLWLTLSWPQQMAVLLHELGHCQLRHKEARWLALPFFWTAWARRLSQQQELAADQFAKRLGFGLDLAWVITRFESYAGKFYPDRATRIAALTGVAHEQAA